MAAALIALSGVTASASTWNKKTYLTVNETIEVPGAVLPPGNYVMKLVDSQSNRNIVQFLNADENKVLSTVIAIPNRRLHVTGDTEFAWHETPANQPPAMRAWFFPGDSFGQEFAYPENRASELAQASKRNVMRTPVSEPETPVAVVRETEVAVVTPTKETNADYEAAFAKNEELDRTSLYQPKTEPATPRQRFEPTEIAQAQPAERPQPVAIERPASRPQAMQQPRNEPLELPQTAGLGALLALIGLGSLSASVAVRKLRNR